MLDNNNQNTIGLRIKELREGAGFTQREFAEKLGISNSAISNIENGKNGARLSTLHAMATVLNISVQNIKDPNAAIIQPLPIAPNDAHAVGLLSDIPVIKLRRVSFKARASFNYLMLQHHLDSDIFDTVLFRLPPGKTEADYADALVFDIDGDSMEPTLQAGQQVIAWPITGGKWEYLHNAVCVVAYGDTVTVKAIYKNDLFSSDGLTLHATGGRGGEFRVAREAIHSIWEVREFYGVVPVRLLP